ncbi:MAG TPA: sigma-70 family RNA polymerase sigma factor [Gemmatimonadaceae bacterium]|nr:sigma-70 family RNA polymerase sigma factor [Gemmatimonadaceae bacterium]
MSLTRAIPIEHSERPSDADLVTAARSAQGDERAFAELVRRYQRMVYAVALSLVQSGDADDVAQDAFTRAFRNLDLLADPAKFGVWLRRITFGVSIDHVRAERSRQRRSTSLGQARRDEDGGSLDIESPEPSALDRLTQHETERRVLAALDRLPARYRVPLTLYHIDGLSHAKVAATLAIPEATVRSIVARARRKLTTLLAHTPEARDMTDDSLDVLDDAAVRAPRMLHVLNGDSVRMTLEQSDVPGAFAPYADVLHEGPVPPMTGTAAWRESRARFLAGADFASYPDALATYERWDAQLASFADYDEVVLWFEHDLFDQLLLIRHLDWFSRQTLGATRLSLICIGEYPGFEPFHGLGQLDANQLASLLGTRAPVTAEQLAFGRRAWEAFTSSDPRRLDAIVREDSSRVLPFFSGGLQRLLEEYPASGTGLPRTERHILELLAREPMSPPALFGAEQRCEERVFMGDWTFWERLHRLASGPVPLIRLEDEAWNGPDLIAREVSITDAGRDVLAGRADAVRLNGFDKWIGGVHLSAALGGDVAWRYNRSGSDSNYIVRTQRRTV